MTDWQPSSASPVAPPEATAYTHRVLAPAAIGIVAGGVAALALTRVLRGMLFTGGEPLYVRSGVPGADPSVPGAWYPLWWPPTKVAGRHLAPYLFARGEEEGLGAPPVGFVDVDIPLSAVTLPG